jgi:acetyl esterase/lipase
MWCDKRDWHLYPGFHALVDGFALVSLNYRLAVKKEYGFPAAVEDVKDAIAYLRTHATELRLDAENFFLYGTSAGGNLVAYAGLDGAGTKGTKRDYHVNAVASLCPLINFAEHMKQLTPKIFILQAIATLIRGNHYLGTTPKRDPERARQASADSRITKDAPPLYIQHGEKDPAVSPRQSIDFYEKLMKQTGMDGDDLVLDIIPGAAHAGAGPEFLEITHVRPIIEFFKRHIK